VQSYLRKRVAYKVSLNILATIHNKPGIIDAYNVMLWKIWGRDIWHANTKHFHDGLFTSSLSGRTSLILKKTRGS
jgi:hypothetical protein